jgi:DNA-binding GntR family transcriptional regulator
MKPRLPDRPTVSDEVAGHLRSQIMSGRARPGERIRLEEIAEQLGVSITPVREALLTLRGEGMVELEPRRGYVVAPMSRQDILDVFTLQGDIAGELAARVAGTVTAAQLAELAALDRKLGTATRGRRVAEIERLEFEFHRAVNLIAGARKLSWFLLTATRYTPARFLSSDPGWRAGMRTDHEALLVAFREGDAASARASMSRHFTDGADRLVKHLDDLGLWS